MSLADGPRGDAVDSDGASSLSQRPNLPRVDISTSRSRFSMARTMRAAQASAVMIFACIIGESPSGSPSGPMARLWISLTTKSGAITLTSTPLPRELDAQRIEEPDHGVFAGRITRAFRHAGEPGEARDRDDQSASIA